MLPTLRLVFIKLTALLVIAVLWPLVNMAQVANCNLICNSDFEAQQVTGPGTFTLTPQANVPCWRTTESDGLIEVWGTGFNGVPSYSGNQFLELNANNVSTLYQSFVAIPGSTASISFAHRGRLGPDVMSVSIGPISGPFTTLGSFTADNTAWVYSTVTYTFPTGAGTFFVLQFNSISATGGNPAVGNFLDAISITLPTPAISLTTVNACSNVNNGAMMADVTGGTAPYTYTWSNAVTGTDTIINLAPAQYVITATDAYGCSAADSATVLANPAPTSTANPVICANGSYTLPDGTVVNTANTYTTHVANAAGCDSIITTNLTVNPVVVTPVTVTICYGTRYTLPTGVGVNTAGTYTDTLNAITGCDSIIVTTLSITPAPVTPVNAVICYGTRYTLPSGVAVNTAGVYVDTLVTNGGCDSVVVTTLSITPPPVTPVTASICYGTRYTLPSGVAVNTAGVYIDTLVTTGGCDSAVVTTLSITPPPVTDSYDSICPGQIYTRPSGQTANATGTYVDTLVTTGGCDSVVITHLTVNPVSSTTVYDTICSGGSFTLPNGTAVSTGGSYPLTLSNRFGCDSVVTTLLTVITLTPVADSTAVLCTGQNTGAIAVTCSGGVLPYTFQLLLNGTVVSSNATGNFNALVAGNYTVSVTDNFRCTAATTTTVTEPTVFALTDSLVNVTCPGYKNGEVKLIATGGVPGYTFMLNNETSSTGTYSKLDTGNYAYVVTDAHGCIDTGTVSITQPAPILITVLPDSLFMYLGKSLQLRATSNFDPNAVYVFSPATGLSCTSCANPVATLNTTTEYTVMATADINGHPCTADTRITVTVIPDYDLFIPNVFTPNGDGLNDYFQLFGNLPAVQYLRIELFDRSGEKVFESNDVHFKYDGTFKGKPLQPQVLIYTIRAVFDDNHTDKLLSGSVTLVK